MENGSGYSTTGWCENRVRKIKLPADDALLPLQPLHDPFLKSHGVSVSVMRLDLVHPFISGNKWFKLRLHLERARQQGQSTLLSFGGAYSNHLLALAAAGREFGFSTIGMVRGEVLLPLNPVLQGAESFGMTLVPLSRKAYCEKDSPDFMRQLTESWGDVHVIPEGGASLYGVQGSMAIAGHLRWSDEQPSARIVTLATATGTTLAGLLAGLTQNCQVDAILVLKGEDRVSPQVNSWLAQVPVACEASWRVLTGWHCGGYARTTPALTQFMESFTAGTGIALDHVYTGKMMASLYTRIERSEIPRGAEVIAIHTGGILPSAD